MYTHSPHRPLRSRWLSAILGSLTLVAAAAPAIADDPGRELTTPTGWVWANHQTQSQVNAIVTGGQRLVTLKIDQISPPTYAITTVSNSGGYSEGWWYYYALDGTQLTSLINANHARLISLDAYDNGSGQSRFNAVMVDNTGANAKAWWYVYDATSSFVDSTVSSNNARLVDLHQYTVNGITRFAAVMISNTGSDALNWHYYYNVNASFIGTQLAATSGRIVDLQVVNPSTPTFNVVMEHSTGQRWWWFYGIDDPSLANLPGQYGARVFDWQAYSTSAGTRYALVMLDNSNALTDRVGDILRAGTDGFSGVYLKHVNGSVLAGLQENRIFEPASLMKTLHHVHAMKQVQLGNITLSTLINVFTAFSGSCPVDSNPISEALQTSLTLMMQNSDNNRTQAIAARFGVANINATAAALGLTNTLVQHRLGCGADAIAHPNHFSLRDVGELHEQVSNGFLNATNRNTFRNIMLSSVAGYPVWGGLSLDTVVNQEAAAAGLSGARTTSFKNNMDLAYKPGGYTLCLNPCAEDRTIGGWVSLPFKSLGVITPHEYVTGAYVNDATNSANAEIAVGQAAAEVLRDEVRAAIHTWSCPADFNADGALNVGDFLAFLATYSSGSPGADFNGDGHVNVQDFLAFLSSYSAGCS
jgi:hypothetical protein